MAKEFKEKHLYIGYGGEEKYLVAIANRESDTTIVAIEQRASRSWDDFCKQAKHKNLILKQEDASDMNAEGDGSYAAVFINYVLSFGQDFANPKAKEILNEVKRVLRPRGRVIVKDFKINRVDVFPIDSSLEKRGFRRIEEKRIMSLSHFARRFIRIRSNVNPREEVQAWEYIYELK